MRRVRRAQPAPTRRDLDQAATNAKIRLGVRLLKMRRDALRQLCREVGLPPARLADLLHVSARYCNRPEIFRRTPWRVLTALASPSMPAEVRQALESKLIKGERITLAEIARATRGSTARGSIFARPPTLWPRSE
jgi:hypothetical protein